MRTWKLVSAGLFVSTLALACGTAASLGDGQNDSNQTAASTPDASSKPPSTTTSTVPPVPAPAVAAAAPDAAAAATMTQTFPVGLDACNGGACTGGYDGDLQPERIDSATKLCTELGFTKATAFTFDGDDQPGGRFCAFSKNAWGCDDSCDGCNPIASVTCTK